MALWVIGDGAVQAAAPVILRGRSDPAGATATNLALVLALAPAGVAAALLADFHAGTVVIGGLVLFGLLFALNSALHSFLILTFRHFPRAATAEGIRAKLAHPPEIVCYALQGEILPCEQQPPAG